MNFKHKEFTLVREMFEWIISIPAVRSSCVMVFHTITSFQRKPNMAVIVGFVTHTAYKFLKVHHCGFNIL